MTTPQAPGGHALVTGGTGFVGTALLRRLVADGWTVDALVRTPDPTLPPGVTARVIPPTVEGIIDLVGTIAPTHCFHLATAFRGVHVPADITPLMDTNLTFGTMLAEACIRIPGIRFVNTGTVWQHYDAAPYSPVSLYAATKQAFADILTFYAEVHDLAVHSIELMDTYGPDDPRPKLIPFLVQAARAGTVLEMTDGTQLIDLVHVEDAVGALLATAAALAGPVYGARGDGAITLRELVERFQRATGLTLDVRWGVRPSRPREMMRPWMTADPPPGWSPRIRLDDGLAALVHGPG